MITRGKTGSLRPKAFLSKNDFPSSFLSEVEPTSVKVAMADSRWLIAMKSEFPALQDNNTWSLIPAFADMNTIGCKWVFKTKFNPDGSVLKHKVRLVAKGFHQQLV